jgi:hypothetical protein
MAAYVEENKSHLDKLIALEGDGWKARIDFSDDSAPKHTPVEFEYEPEEDQKALNDMLYENYCLRLRCQCITEAKRQFCGLWPSGAEITMRLYNTYTLITTFP